MISIIMSVYNERFNWIVESINSMLYQTYKDIELIIVVDNPNLNNEVCAYLNRLSDEEERVKIIYNEKNIGLANSMNKALKEAKGDFIARMDADDVSEVDRLEKELSFLIEENADMVSTNAMFIDEEGHVIGKGRMIEKNQNAILPYTNQIIHPSVLAKASSFRLVEGYRDFKRTQDYDCWLRMLTSNLKIVSMNDYLLKYRRSLTQASNKHRLEQYYVVQYQQGLLKERMKKGTDSFSREGLEKYLLAKKITEKKNEKCLCVLEMLKKTHTMPNIFLKLSLITKSFFLFPSIVINLIISHFKMKKAKVKMT